MRPGKGKKNKLMLTAIQSTEIYFFFEGGRYETYGNLPPQLEIEPAPCALEEVSTRRKELDEGRQKVQTSSYK